MLLPLFPSIGLLTLDPEPLVPQGWRAVFVQHLGQGRYQWLASAHVHGRTYRLALGAARATAARLSQHVAQHGPHLPATSSALLAPFVPAARFL